jgi:hypothetical protein
MAGKYGLDWDREETDHMTTMTKVLLAAAAFALPFAAAAQSNDAKYCKALSDTYRQTVAKDTTPNADVPVAMAKCEAGDPAVGIPILEKALKDAKVNLPPRP